MSSVSVGFSHLNSVIYLFVRLMSSVSVGFSHLNSMCYLFVCSSDVFSVSVGFSLLIVRVIRLSVFLYLFQWDFLT